MVRGAQKHVVAYLRDFLFDERQALMPVSRLSGGERARLLLARLFAAAQQSPDHWTSPPTISTWRPSICWRKCWTTTTARVLLVSHDRDFLDRAGDLDHRLVGDGSEVEHVGGYSRSAAARDRRNPAASQSGAHKPRAPSVTPASSPAASAIRSSASSRG